MIGQQDNSKTHLQAGANFKYDVFISYKRSESGKFASRLELELEKYKPPGGLNLPERYLNVFRDKEDLRGNEYYQAIERSLGESAKMVVLCSPLARASEYVNDEIRRFARINNPQNIIPLLISGIPNNAAAREEEKAFPDALFEVGAMPLAIDYSGFNSVRAVTISATFTGITSGGQHTRSWLHSVDIRNL